MELEKIKELVALMTQNDLTELEIADGESRIALKRGRAESAPPVVAVPPMIAMGPAATMIGTPLPLAASPAPAGESAEADKLLKILSPIVGTFYSTPSPDADPFVEVGRKVDEDSVVCIIEAMKVMNEIKSEVRGIIRKVLVSNGQAVEYGQPLFLVEPE